MPVNAFLRLVASSTPCGKLRIHRLQIGDAPLSQALRGHRGELDLGDVQSAAVVGRVMYFQPPRETERLLRRKRLVKRRERMRVQVAHRKHDFFSPGILPVKQPSDATRPVDFGSARECLRAPAFRFPSAAAHGRGSTVDTVSRPCKRRACFRRAGAHKRLTRLPSRLRTRRSVRAECAAGF